MARKVMNGLDLQNQRITSVADASAGTDAVNLQTLQTFVRGLIIKDAVRAATTANVNLSAPGASIDGVTLGNGDRFLAKDQTTPSQKGIYIFNGSGSAATRATDADTGTELRPGTAVFVTEGSVNASRQYVITSTAAIVIGTDGMTWSQFGGGNTYSAGNGLGLAGTVFNVVPGTGIISDGTSTRIDTSVVARKFASNIGNGSSTTITVTHSLGTKDIQVEIYDNATGETAEPDVTNRQTNTVDVVFASAPASNAYRVVVVG